MTDVQGLAFLLAAIVTVGGLLAIGDVAIRIGRRIAEWLEFKREERARAALQAIVDDSPELRPCDVIFLKETQAWKDIHGPRDVA